MQHNLPHRHSPVPLVSRDIRRRVGMKPSTIPHPQRSHRTAQAVCNPKYGESGKKN